MRKSGHSGILAPLAATLVASVALAAGLALTRAVEARAPRRRARAKRRLGLAPREEAADGLRRMALEQADVVIEQLEDAAAGEQPTGSVHEARKAIKRLRTIVRVLEDELGPARSAQEHDALREAAGLLAGARDAEVMLATLDALLARGGRKLARRPGAVALRLALAAERDLKARESLSPPNLARAIGALRGFRARAAAWQHGAPDGRGIGLAEPGLRRIYRQGRNRMGRAAGKHGGRMDTMHRWRKRVKDLRYALEALERPAGAAARKRAHERAERLRRLAARADGLGEVLGEEHDLAVLGVWIERNGAGAGTRRRLGRQIEKRRAKLRRRALAQGRKLYRRRPRRFVADVARAARIVSR